MPFLDKTGLAHLWNHIVARLNSKVEREELDAKADKSTTLSGYGITNAYTKTETDTKIQSAVSSAGHLKRSVVTTLPSASAADANTIYMVKDTSVTSGDAYKEYMLINGTMTQIGDTSVSLNGYATESYADNAAGEAAAGVQSNLIGEQWTDSESSNTIWGAKRYADKVAEGKADAEHSHSDYVTESMLNGIIAGSTLPTVTTSNNGQFLRVVDGTWVAATVDGAESATF
jgi:hypothetical protein